MPDNALRGQLPPSSLSYSEALQVLFDALPMSEECRVKVIETIISVWGGYRVYVPNCARRKRAEAIRAVIAEQFTGRNVCETGKACGVTVRTVYRYLNQKN